MGNTLTINESQKGREWRGSCTKHINASECMHDFVDSITINYPQEGSDGGDTSSVGGHNRVFDTAGKSRVLTNPMVYMHVMFPTIKFCNPKISTPRFSRGIENAVMTPPRLMWRQHTRL